MPRASTERASLPHDVPLGTAPAGAELLHSRAQRRALPFMAVQEHHQIELLLRRSERAVELAHDLIRRDVEMVHRLRNRQRHTAFIGSVNELAADQSVVRLQIEVEIVRKTGEAERTRD